MISSFRRHRLSIRLKHAGATHVGRVRHSNQDFRDSTQELHVLADGMGGHQGGEVAASIAVSTTLSQFKNPSRVALIRAVAFANSAILERSTADKSLSGMGTTLCALAAVVGESGLDGLAVVNVGDSRIYRWARGELFQVTEDHSLVADLVRSGELTVEEAARHPQRNILTRALGINHDLIVDTWELIPVIGDRYLLCSDGLFNELSDERISELLEVHKDPSVLAQELVDRAVDSGGHDNVTVGVVDVVNAPEDVSDDWVLPLSRPEKVTDLYLGKRQSLNQFSWRLTAFIVSSVFLIAVLFSVIGVYARSGWFVGEYDGGVALFKGKPSGILWFDPTVERIARVSILDLPEAHRYAVLENIPVDSEEEGRDLIENLRASGR